MIMSLLDTFQENTVSSHHPKAGLQIPGKVEKNTLTVVNVQHLIQNVMMN